MNDESILKSAHEATLRCLERHEVRFTRGEPRAFFAKFTQVCAGLTLPIVPRERLAELIRLKNLLCAWNFVVDDEIDREGTRGHLDASAQLLLERLMDKPRAAPRSSAARILEQVLTGLPSGRPQYREALLFDLQDAVTGFYYEHHINRWRSAANTIEYSRNSTATVCIKTYLDLDCLFAEDEVPPATYAALRHAYEHLTLALKYASDIGSLGRELSEEDNLNFVRIQAMEAGAEAYAAGRASVEAERTLIRFADEARRLAESHLANARARLVSVAAPDTATIVRTASTMVQTYAGGVDMFYEGQGGLGVERRT